jgi:1-acyl-sn-glycerol-3-phosphate acyltransferase
MAVSPPDTGSTPAPAPGRHHEFAVEPRRTVGYRIFWHSFHGLLALWFRPRVVGREHVPLSGPVILAPVHRSFADFALTAFCTRRKLFFMTKDSMWKNKHLGNFLFWVGAFPVHRESADREALQRAEEVLKMGQVLVLFPEGTRRSSPAIEDLMEGASFLSARTGAPIVPIGIGASDLAMPKGSTVPKPYTIHMVVGPPMAPPARTEGGRVSRSAVHAATTELVGRLQEVYDESKARTGRYPAAPTERSGARPDLPDR